MFVDRRAWQPLNTALSSNRAHMSSSSQPQSRKRRRSPQNSDSDDDDRGHARSQPLPFSEPFPCIFRHKNCMLAFKSAQTMRTHLNNAHSEDVPLASCNYDKCATCNNFSVKLANDNRNLRRHKFKDQSCKGRKVRPEGNNVSPPRHPSLPSSDSSFDSLDSPTAPVSLSSSPPQPEGEGSSSLPPISGLDLPIAGEMVRRLAAKGATVNIPVHAQEGWIEANKGVWAGAMALAGDAGAEEVSRILMATPHPLATITPPYSGPQFRCECFFMFLIYRPSPYSQSRCGVLIQEGFTIETGANSARVGQYPPASH